MNDENSYKMSVLMQRLNEDSTSKARSFIKSKFRDISDLDEVAELIIQTKKDLSLAESQLHVSVQGKLEALKRAADIMDESSVKLSTFSTNLHKIEERINATNTIISSFEYLRRAHFAKENTAKVIHQVDFFADIPKKVEKLKVLLDEDPTALKDVFLEAVKLDSLRVGLLNEIVVSRERRASEVVPMKPGGMHSSIQETNQTRDRIENYLKGVPELMKLVLQRLSGNVERFLEVAIDSPQDLVMTFEVIEMYSEYVDRRARAKHPSAIHFQKLDDISEKSKQRIRDILSNKVEAVFEITINSPEYQKTPVASILAAATQLVSLMTEYKNEIIVCIPPHYDPLTIFVEAFEERLIPEIKSLVKQKDDPKALTVLNLVEIIDWIEYYIAQMGTYEEVDSVTSSPSMKARGPACKSVSEFTKISEDLMNEYLFRIKNQVLTWFGNIRNLPVEIIRTADGNLITAHPEEMFNLIYLQVDIAREKLPVEHLKDVLNACLQVSYCSMNLIHRFISINCVAQVLREVQRESYDDLNNNWKNLEVETLCVTVNDNQRMQEKCDEFGEKIIKLVVQPDQREWLGAMLEEISNEFVALSVTTVNYLARFVTG